MKTLLKNLCLCCSLFFFTYYATAQDGRAAVQASMFHNSSTLESAMTKNFTKIYKANINGTPYYNEKFVTANISPFDKVFLVRYNAALDEMEVIRGKDTLIMSKGDRSYVIKQHSEDLTYKILESPSSEKPDRLGYFVELIDNEKLSLYRKDRKKFEEVKKAAYNGNLNAQSARFKTQKSEFYIEKRKTE